VLWLRGSSGRIPTKREEERRVYSLEHDGRKTGAILAGDGKGRKGGGKAREMTSHYRGNEQEGVGTLNKSRQ